MEETAKGPLEPRDGCIGGKNHVDPPFPRDSGSTWAEWEANGCVQRHVFLRLLLRTREFRAQTQRPKLHKGRTRDPDARPELAWRRERRSAHQPCAHHTTQQRCHIQEEPLVPQNSQDVVCSLTTLFPRDVMRRSSPRSCRVVHPPTRSRRAQRSSLVVSSHGAITANDPSR